ncbi:hypothetical protein AeRB84_002638 [Aphanomyces euteiches]|nr:hypothetical protein AeRB84_002638 [Aphanomyces euteiches]
MVIRQRRHLKDLPLDGKRPTARMDVQAPMEFADLVHVFVMLAGLALRAMFLKNGFARHTATMLVMVVIVVVGFTTPIAEKFLTM